MLAYGAIIISAVGVAVCIARYSQRGLGLSSTERLGVGLGAFCGAMIGAKLPFVFSDWNEFLSGAAWFSNGKTILLGMVGGYFGVETAKWCLGVRVRTGDSFVVPVAAAIAIGRLGCFVGGCCYGTPTDLPWGVVFPHVDPLPRHPTQIYESIFHATCAIVLAIVLHNGWCRGNLMKLYIILYAAYRFATEFIRPEARFLGGWTAYQFASIVLAIGFGCLWWRDARLMNKVQLPSKSVE
ncbi:MAG: prolipoprotein diacylglyceryl transferase [Planctomycetia bacterium]|nr:prolipoprotein diacylglyceryl transferase [Planctomycetia bacterium]